MLENPAVEKVTIVVSEDLSVSEAANVCACISAGLAANSPTWAAQALTDAQGMGSVASSHLPIVILKANAARFTTLLEQLSSTDRPLHSSVSLFPAYAKTMHDAKLYWEKHSMLSHGTEAMLGIGLAGNKRWINSLVGSFPLLR
jgi:hypothetical protein